MEGKACKAASTDRLSQLWLREAGTLQSRSSNCTTLATFKFSCPIRAIVSAGVTKDIPTFEIGLAKGTGPFAGF